jgi:hypothetical protein
MKNHRELLYDRWDSDKWNCFFNSIPLAQNPTSKPQNHPCLKLKKPR